MKIIGNRIRVGFPRSLLGVGLVAGSLFVLSPSAMAAEVPSNWSFGMNFFFTNDQAPGKISQDPLTLTLGATSTTQITRMKPPLPPGKAKTNDAGYPLIDAFVMNNGQRVYNFQGTPDSQGRKVFKVSIGAEQAGALVSITLDCANLDPSISLTLVQGRTQKKATVSKNNCGGLQDFLEVGSATVPEELFIVGAANGAGFIGKTSDGSVIGSIATDQKNNGVAGVQMTVGGQPVTLTTEGAFKVTGLTGLQEVIIRRKGHLTRKVNIDLGGEEPGILPILAGGDADGNNTVNLMDFGVLKQNFNKPTNDCYNNPDIAIKCADFDGDGDIDISDFGVLKRNFNAKGDD